MLLSLCNCKYVISTACPDYIIYSDEFKENLKKDLQNNKSYFINQVIIDMFNINESLKICNGIK